MTRTKYLPEAYTDIDGNRLKVGQWIISSGSFWQLTEAQPGQYQAVSPARKQTRNFTVKDSARCEVAHFPLSKKIRLEDYPQLLKRFHDKGIEAFFVTLEQAPGVGLQMIKPRTRFTPILLPNVPAAKENTALLEQWLVQAIWIAENPKKNQTLAWIVEQKRLNPFGSWPEINSPIGLNRWAMEWQHLYQDYLRKKQLEWRQHTQSLLPPATPVAGQLPPEYRNALGDRYPFIVGECVSTVHFYGSAINSPFNDAYLWRLHEPEPGLYTAVGYGVEQTVILTPENSTMVYPLAIKVSERLALDRYSKYMQLYREKGLAAYFYENAQREIVLRAIVLSGPAKNTQDIAPEPFMVADMERSPALLERWLDQMMWCMLNPERCKILFWALKYGRSFFGDWPELYPPHVLAQSASELLPIYEADLKRVRTPEELAAEQQELAHKAELNEQTMLMSKLQLGLLDNSIYPSIDSLLDGTGIDKPE